MKDRNIEFTSATFRGSAVETLYTEKEKKPLVCATVISLDQYYQRDQAFGVFVNLVEQEYQKGRIKSLKIYLTDFLKRYYTVFDPTFPALPTESRPPLAEENDLSTSISEEISEVLARQLGKQWKLDHEEKYLKSHDLPYEIVTWESLLNMDSFKSYHHLICTDYQEGTNATNEFQRKVKSVAGNYVKGFVARCQEKGLTVDPSACLQNAIAYLLEEAAVSLLILNSEVDFITYPGPWGGNDVLKCAFKKHLAHLSPNFWIKCEIHKNNHNNLTQFFQSQPKPNYRKAILHSLEKTLKSLNFEQWDPAQVQCLTQRLQETVSLQADRIESKQDSVENGSDSSISLVVWAGKLLKNTTDQKLWERIRARGAVLSGYKYRFILTTLTATPDHGFVCLFRLYDWIKFYHTSTYYVPTHKTLSLSLDGVNACLLDRESITIPHRND